MEISASQVKELRDKTGAGFMECKAALAESNGDLSQAITILRTKGQAKAEKRAGRSTSQGVIGHYIHQGGQVAVIVEVNCESDFVARTDDFQGLVKEIAMHIAAANPTCVRREDVPADDIDNEKTIKIVEGKINSYYEQVVLLDQPSIRDPKTTIGTMVTAAVAKLGENISIARFARFKVGESAD